MGESVQAGSLGPTAVHRCYYCGTEHKSDIRYCAECKRYQPDPMDLREQAVSPCRVCRELIPRGAVKCNHCSAFQRGIGRWLPTSAATISALGALAALVILLLNTVANRPRAPRSKTDLQVFDYDDSNLYLKVTNEGTKPSFVGEGWFKVALKCDWREKEPAFCSKPGGEVPRGVLKLKANPQPTALISPGPAIVSFHRKSAFAEEDRPLKCDATFETEVAQSRFRLCTAFEIIEYQKSMRRCEYRELSNLTNVNYLQFVRMAICGKP